MASGALLSMEQRCPQTFLGALRKVYGESSTCGMHWIVLASESPRRIEICKTMGIRNLHVIPSGFCEDLSKAVFPTAEDYCAETSRRKAERVAKALWTPNEPHFSYDVSISPPPSESCIVIACDTVVEIDGTILEKPGTREEVLSMLERLSGREHRVHSAVTIYTKKHGLGTPADAFCSTTEVQFQDISMEDIQAYADTGEPFDKAGGYGIQGIGGQFVERIHGCYYNVMGLPMQRLSVSLASLMLSQRIFP